MARQPVREQPQVNPWPGTVRPALPVPGAVSGRRASGRTSDVLPDPDPVVHEPGILLGAPLSPAEIELPREARAHAQERPAPEVPLPQDVPATGGRESAGAPVLGRPVLPSAALPGPVLPGVEPFVHPDQEAPSRRAAPASGALHMPSMPGGAATTGELDLRLVRDVAADAADKASRAAGPAPTLSRRRLELRPSVSPT